MRFVIASSLVEKKDAVRVPASRPAGAPKARRPPSDGRRPPSNGERESFVLEQTKLTPVPFAPEIRVFMAPAVNPVWFETARWLDDDNVAVPFWCVPWAGGQALARYLLDHPETVRGARVLDFACGGGVVAIAAARAGAHVVAVDVEPLACVATKLSAAANSVSIDVRTTDIVGDRLPDIDIVLAGDIWYERAPAARFRRWFTRLRERGVEVLTGEAGRGYAPRRARELARYEVPTPFDLEGVNVRTTRVLAIEASSDGAIAPRVSHDRSGR
jgi:predicted nicotinamide N-methyase